MFNNFFYFRYKFINFIGFTYNLIIAMMCLRDFIFRTVHSCVSAEAACKVATLLYRRIPGDSQNYWRVTFAYSTHTAN